MEILIKDPLNTLSNSSELNTHPLLERAENDLEKS